MNSLTILCFVLAAASASPNSYYYNSQFPTGTSQTMRFARSGYVGFGSVAPALTSEDTASLKTLADLGSPALIRASASLNELMKGLPALLKNMDPAIKQDVAKVGVVIAEVCAKLVADPEAPSGYLKITKGSLKTTCDYINKVANDVVLGFGDPTIIQGYVNELNTAVIGLAAKASTL